MSHPFSLVEMLGRALPRLEIVDIGAMAVKGERPPYLPLLGHGRVVGFEPVQAECDKLNASCPKDHLYLPYFIGDGTERTFHLCNEPMTSSLFEPNTALLRRFQNLAELTRVVSTSPVPTRRLDDVPEIAAIDFLKADVQGAELDVFRGATRLLAGTGVIETEVEFVEMYKGQPLFAEVDTELRRQGFFLHCFSGLAGRTFKPLIGPAGPNRPIKQILWGNAVYVKDFMSFSSLEPVLLLKIAAMVHDAYGSHDLASLALRHYDARTGGKVWEAYIRRVMGRVPAAPPVD